MTSFDKVIRSQGFWLAVVLVLGLFLSLTVMGQMFSTPARADVEDRRVLNPGPGVIAVAGEVVTATVVTPTRNVTPTLVALVPTSTPTVEPTRTRFPTARPTNTNTPEPTRTPFPTAVPTSTPVPPTRTQFPTAVPTNTRVPPLPTVVPTVVVAPSVVHDLPTIVSGPTTTKVVLRLETATPDPRLGTLDDQALFIEQTGDCLLSQWSVGDWFYGGPGSYLWQCTDVYLTPGTKMVNIKSRDNVLKFTGKLVPFGADSYYEVTSTKSGKIFWVKKY